MKGVLLFIFSILFLLLAGEAVAELCSTGCSGTACQRFYNYCDICELGAGCYSDYVADDSCNALCGSGTCSGGSCVASSCTPNWSCTAWSPVDSTCGTSFTQTRTCTDSNSCGTTSGKPAELQASTGGSCPGVDPGTCFYDSACDESGFRMETTYSCNYSTRTCGSSSVNIACSRSTSGSACSDGNACVIGETCFSGSCQGGSAVNCGTQSKVCSPLSESPSVSCASTCNPASGCSSCALNCTPRGSLVISPSTVDIGQTFNVSISGSDDEGLNWLVLVEGNQWFSCYGSSSCSNTWTTSRSSAGSSLLEGYVYDSGDNVKYLSGTVTVRAPDSADCNNEAARRGYPGGECYQTNSPPPPFSTAFCSGYTNSDALPDVGTCSGALVTCGGCYSCPNAMPSDVFTIPGSSCSVTINGQGWDDSDGTMGGYHRFDKGAGWQEGVMSDNACGGENLKIRNAWSVSGNQFNITTNAERLGTTQHNVTAGFNLSSNCNIREVAKSATGGGGFDPVNAPASCATGATYKAKTNAGYTTYTFDAEYCGDGEQNCGEVCDPTVPGQSNCKADCSGMSDTVAPTATINLIRKSNGEDVSEGAVSNWLKADTYTIQFDESDNVGGSGLASCQYTINLCDSSGVNCPTAVVGITSRSCKTSTSVNRDMTIGPSTPYDQDGGYRYMVYSIVRDNAGNVGMALYNLGTDFQKPTVQ